MKTIEDYKNQIITGDIIGTDEFQEAYHNEVLRRMREKGLENTEDNYNEVEGEVIKEYNIKFK